MSSDVERIKERLSIVDVVAPYVKLEKAGRNFKGKSPFNTERTPSFFVSPEKNLFHCFSSQKGGDIFTFIQEVEGIDFQTALKLLADKAGITLSKTNVKENSERAKLYEAMEWATKFYEVQFRQDKEAVAYLEGRGVTKETMKEFRIGYAPAGWQHLYDTLKAKGFDDVIIEKAGLGVAGKKGLYDRFRERIMFPIADSQGRVIAFTGRIFVKPDSDTDPKATGKYVNSPETPIYHKSNVLYAYDKARRTMMKEDHCVIVEGQMDTLMSHQAGVTNTVALSGTALTAEQVQLIQRFTDNIILSLDADRAGIDATKRSAEIAYEHDMSVAVAFITGGKDPADLVQDDPSLWHVALAEATPYIDYRLATLGNQELSIKEKTKAVQADLFPSIHRMQGSIMQDEALQKVSHFLQVAHQAVRDDFVKWQSQNNFEIQNSQSENRHDAVLSRSTASSLSEKEKGESINSPAFENELMSIFIWKETDETVAPYRDQYRDIVGLSWFEKVWQQALLNKNSLIFEAELRYDNVPQDKLLHDIEQLLVHAKLKTLQKQQRNITQKLRQAEQAGDDETSHKLLKAYQEVAQKIEDITKARVDS